MQKYKKIIIGACICLVCICGLFCITKNLGGDSVVGVWRISGYEYKGETFNTNDVMKLCEKCGYSLLEWSNSTLEFTSNGKVCMTREEDGKPYRITGQYIVGETFVELLSDSGDSDGKLLRYDGKRIYYDIPSGIVLIFHK